MSAMEHPSHFPAIQREDASGFSGRWMAYKPRPARIELDRFVLELEVKGKKIAGHLEMPNLMVPLQGSLEGSSGEARFSATAQGRTMSFELRRTGAELVGRVDQWGRVSGMRAVRVSPELEAEAPFSELTQLEVEFPIELAEHVIRRGLDDESSSVLRESILALMKHQRVVGLSVAIVRGNDVVDIRSFGWEDYHNEIPVSRKTMYRWASVSKPLTALAALILSEEKRLDLRADVRKLVPEWPRPEAGVTPFTLMTHQSGIAGDDDIKPRTIRSYSSEHPWANTTTALDMFSETELLFVPGHGVQYSTPAYVLLGAVIESAAEMPYAQFVKERVCAPLGMTSMRPDRIWETIANRAAGYGEMNKDEGVFLQFDDDISWKTPAGGWISTIEDFGRFVAGLMGQDLVSIESQEAMWEAANTATGEPTNYGLGVIVQQFEERLSVSHSGSQLKASTHFVCLPEEQLGVVVMCNKEGVVLTQLAAQILGACL